MKKLTDDLKAVNKEINVLSKKLDQLSKKADKLMKATTAKKVKTKAAPGKKAVKKAKAAPAKKPAKKAPVPKNEAAKKTVKKAAVSATPTNKVLTFMKRYKKGVSISKLKEQSGLNDKQISNILHRASKEGKIKRVARGVYQLA
jgi:predicted Rossmann fold nucleotide-binding protein DprA/Smf involved in DNA uptake